ncbi:uncharacterized protein LOC118183193 isoform X2 [Stegodyphus dumicola]|nr:uncharacterized protein LOC118183193 isoform X2 [Stegodyphus dumicola]
MQNSNFCPGKPHTAEGKTSDCWDDENNHAKVFNDSVCNNKLSYIGRKDASCVSNLNFYDVADNKSSQEHGINTSVDEKVFLGKNSSKIPHHSTLSSSDKLCDLKPVLKSETILSDCLEDNLYNSLIKHDSVSTDKCKSDNVGHYSNSREVCVDGSQNFLKKPFSTSETASTYNYNLHDFSEFLPFHFTPSNNKAKYFDIYGTFPFKSQEHLSNPKPVSSQCTFYETKADKLCSRKNQTKKFSYENSLKKGKLNLVGKLNEEKKETFLCTKKKTLPSRDLKMQNKQEWPFSEGMPLLEKNTINETVKDSYLLKTEKMPKTVNNCSGGLSKDVTFETEQTGFIADSLPEIAANFLSGFTTLKSSSLLTLPDASQPSLTCGMLDEKLSKDLSAVSDHLLETNQCDVGSVYDLQKDKDASTDCAFQTNELTVDSIGVLQKDIDINADSAFQTNECAVDSAYVLQKGTDGNIDYAFQTNDFTANAVQKGKDANNDCAFLTNETAADSAYVLQKDKDNTDSKFQTNDSTAHAVHVLQKDKEGSTDCTFLTNECLVDSVYILQKGKDANTEGAFQTNECAVNSVYVLQEVESSSKNEAFHFSDTIESVAEAISYDRISNEEICDSLNKIFNENDTSDITICAITNKSNLCDEVNFDFEEKNDINSEFFLSNLNNSETADLASNISKENLIDYQSNICVEGKDPDICKSDTSVLCDNKPSENLVCKTEDCFSVINKDGNEKTESQNCDPVSFNLSQPSEKIMRVSELKHISNLESEMETENGAVNLIIPANLYDVALIGTSSSNNCISTNVNNCISTNVNNCISTNVNNCISTNSYAHILKNYDDCDSSANIESRNFDPLEMSKIELLQKERQCVKSFQKSKKTFTQRTNNHKLIPKQSARKSASSANIAFSNFGDIGIAYKRSGKSINEKQNKDRRYESNFKKRKMGKTVIPLREFQIENSDSSSSSSVLSVQNEDDILPIAKKTFKKPFTAARKSVMESRDLVPKLAAKTFPCRQQATITLTNLVISDSKEDSVTFLSLKNASDGESSNLSEMSDEDVRNTRICSPVKELMISHPVCCCSEKEKPCICTDGNLQEVCEGEDTVDDNIIPCSNKVSKQYLLTPSSEIRHRAFCDIHLWRLQRHHCCPKCGVFCTQGSFMLCSSDDTGKTDDQPHLFHQGCFLLPVPGLPPRCPHCCKYSIFKTINLFLMTHSGVQDSKNCELSSDIKNLTSDLEDYNILMKSADSVSQKIGTEKMPFVPESHDLQTMIDALANDKSLHLRPKGKCLYNPIKTGDVKKVVHLIANGVNPNHKFKMHKNATPLHVAAHHGFTGIIHILCQAGALIDTVNDDLETPLMVAVDKNQISAVRYLVLSGAQTDTKNENGLTVLHIAARNGFLEIAQYLYNTGYFDINIQDDGGWTPLVWACENKHDDFIKWLLEMKADPNIRDEEENTALHWAAYSGVVSIVQDLLDNGCNLNYVNLRGDTALHIAAREDNYDCVRLLLMNGAILDKKNKDDETPIMCCGDNSLSWKLLNHYKSMGPIKGKLEQRVVFRDISRGSEVFPIEVINEVDEEEFIMEFRYITKSCFRSGVDINTLVDTMQLCYCRDKCISRYCTCVMSSKCWYDLNGCLVSDFDFHGPPAIFECNKTCHCSKACINRVVQRGLRIPLQLFRTLSRGWGVRTLRKIPKGSFVCEYVGELITGHEAIQRGDDTYFFDLESETADYCLDGRFYGNIARFLNHSCEPNLIALKVFVEHQDLNFPRIAFFTLKEVQAYEELCFDYGIDFWIIKCQTVLCTCNSKLCKYSKDSIDATFETYLTEME